MHIYALIPWPIPISIQTLWVWAKINIYLICPGPRNANAAVAMQNV